MAVVSQGTKISIPPAKIPNDYTRPTVDAFSDYTEESKLITLTIPKSVAVANRKTTLTNIIQDNTYGIEKQISVLLGKYDKNPPDVHFWVDLRDLTTDQDPSDLASGFLTDDAVDYKAQVRYFIKSVTP